MVSLRGLKRLLAKPLARFWEPSVPLASGSLWLAERFSKAAAGRSLRFLFWEEQPLHLSVSLRGRSEV
jgi:hypothetical protein